MKVVEKLKESLLPHEHSARSHEQESHRQDQASSNTQCWSTEFGDICTLQPAEPRQSASESEEAKSSGAGKSFDRVRTGLGEVQVLGTSETADSLRTEFGEVRILGKAPADSHSQAAADQEESGRRKEGVPATPPSTPQASMTLNQQDDHPLRPSVSSAIREVRGGGNVAQPITREFQPICSSKTFTTVVDQPCEKEIVEVIREHRLYEKIFVVETRPAGERELLDRQQEEEIGTRTVMGYATPASSPCAKAPELVVSGR